MTVWFIRWGNRPAACG